MACLPLLLQIAKKVEDNIVRTWMIFGLAFCHNDFLHVSLSVFLKVTRHR